jgi:hypothetical protein
MRKQNRGVHRINRQATRIVRRSQPGNSWMGTDNLEDRT